MNQEENPVDLSSLERRLQNRRAVELSAALKSRVMKAVTRELLPSFLPVDRRSSFLSFAAALAASLLVGLNLAFTATSAMSLQPRFAAMPERTLDNAAAMQQLSPDLTRSEALRLSLLLQAGGHFWPVPELHASFGSSPQGEIAPDHERNVQ